MDRHIKLAWELRSGTDREATTAAAELIRSHLAELSGDCSVVEIWDGARYVALLPISNYLPP